MHVGAPLPKDIAARISEWPEAAQNALLDIRGILLDAAEEADVAPLNESLKWTEPAWRPKAPRTGSTLRVAWKADDPDRIGLYVHCQTGIAATMGEIYPDAFDNDGIRALRLGLADPLPREAVDHLARMVFTWHRRTSRAKHF